VKSFKKKLLVDALSAMVCCSITGYSYEPWHFRYVGKETAKKISDAGLVLEEYLR